MGEAIIAAVVGAEVAAPADVRVYDIVSSRVDYLHQTYGVAPAVDTAQAVAGNDLVLIALKPQEFDKAAPGMARALGEATAVSIMAGVTIPQLAQGLRSNRVIRAMP